jgi:hypothetical protein
LIHSTGGGRKIVSRLPARLPRPCSHAVDGHLALLCDPETLGVVE